MADLLTHVLVPYVVLTIASWRVGWLDRSWVVVAMAGAIIPDLVKLSLLVDASTIGSLLGVSFTYQAVSSLGGVVLLAAAGTLAFQRRLWPRVFGLLVFGGFTALLLDGMRKFATGTANPWLYPFLYDRIPTPNLYVTADTVVPLVAVTVAIGVFALDQYAIEE